MYKYILMTILFISFGCTTTTYHKIRSCKEIALGAMLVNLKHLSNDPFVPLSPDERSEIELAFLLSLYNYIKGCEEHPDGYE